MRFYEWRQYRDKTVRPLILKCSTHELFGEATGLVADIDRAFRIVGYTKVPPKKTYKRRKAHYNRRELDQKWLEHDIKSKLAYLEDILIIMRLGS